MCDLEILRELIMPCALVTIENSLYGKQKVKLTESPKNHDFSGYTVNINNIPQRSIVIKADAFPPTNRFFNNSKKECKRADFVIVTNMDNRNYILFIEMKKGKAENSKIIQQLKGAQCIVDYFRSIVNTFWNGSGFFDPAQYNYRFISIRDIRLNKKPTFQSNSSGIHDQAERLLKISAPHNLQFGQLIGKAAN